MLLSARAPGRVCLLGEHCDWAGGSCLVAPLSRGVSARARPADAFELRSRFGVSHPSPAAEVLPEDPNRYAAAVLRLLLAEGWPLPPLRVHIDSDLPDGRGFSSSAALCVALVRALAPLAPSPLDPAAIAELAYRAERELLGVGCGRMDPLACAYAAPLFIRWTPETELRPLSTPPLHLLAAANPRSRPAAELLQALAASTQSRATIWRWGELAEHGAERLNHGDLPALGAAMDEAQRLYEALDLPELRAPWLAQAVRAARSAGALGAKFTGAGGDRSVVALFADERALARGAEALRALGAEVI